MSHLSEDMQCTYCGVMIRDRRLKRSMSQDGWKVDACVLCHFVLGLPGNLGVKTLMTRQQRVREVLRIGEHTIRHWPNDKTYITTNGTLDILPVDQQRKRGRPRKGEQ